MKFLLIIQLFLYVALQSNAQNLVYVDGKGVMRYTKTKAEASFFGVNYTVPFAYGYRSHQALGVDLEKAITTDVYHMSRLGLDAFRVHVWDTEISDSLGNLKENEHLRLFDFLVWKLKEKNIKIFLTPLAFWGSGYPEPDIRTGSFSSKWNKQQVLVTEAAIKAQENYLAQLLKHVNPYTKQTYGQDQDIIALEINNEPHHSGTKQQAADYISRMVKAVRGTGWSKPVFYNISESPRYAEPVANADIQGVSFQWYPTGLVANHTLHGNYLPHVDHYAIPFDTIPAYRNKARMVYEFDAGDVYESYMYPAMARSFRTAGFQWATQFAYDPLATAYGNTEYQTHYLNLAYTPSKAISLLIASEVFHRVPRLKSYGRYPHNTSFDVFRVSYEESLSEMNASEKFYYSNTTQTQPVKSAALQRIAGVGKSPIIQYEGTGAYFLDRLSAGVWRLEVMPDAVVLRDPFERASPKKTVTELHYNENKMTISIPDLSAGFVVTGTDGKIVSNDGNGFSIRPGVYTIMRNGAKIGKAPAMTADHPKEFFEKKSEPEITVVHQPFGEVSTGRPFILKAMIPGVDSSYRVSVELRHTANQWKTIAMQRTSGIQYIAEVPAELAIPGMINYRIIVQKEDSFLVFPGEHQGNPYAWDNLYDNETWQTFVAAPGAPLLLFDPFSDRRDQSVFNPDWRSNSVNYITGERPGRLVMQVQMKNAAPGQMMAAQFFAGDKLASRASNLDAMKQVILRAKGQQAGERVKVVFITKSAAAFSTEFELGTAFSDNRISLNQLRPDSFLLLPRPYPGFLPLYFDGRMDMGFRLEDLEKVQLIFLNPKERGTRSQTVEIESIELRQ